MIKINIKTGLTKEDYQLMTNKIKTVKTSNRLLTNMDYDWVTGTVADKISKPKIQVMTICGRGFLRTIQSLAGTSSQIIHTGVSNSWDNPIFKDEDFYQYTCNGITNNIITSNIFDIISNPLIDYMRKEQFTAICFYPEKADEDGYIEFNENSAVVYKLSDNFNIKIHEALIAFESQMHDIQNTINKYSSELIEIIKDNL